MPSKVGDIETRALMSISVFIAWVTGVLVALAVGFGMISGTLSVPYIPEFITATAGWIVVVLALLGAVIAIIERMTR